MPLLCAQLSPLMGQVLNPHGLWPQKKLNRFILVKLLITFSCCSFIFVKEQNVAVPLYLYPISMIKVSGDFKVAFKVLKFRTMRVNFERHVFYWLIFIWSHYWREMIQLGELTNTCVKIYQVIRSLQMLTVIFALKLKMLQRCPGLRYMVFLSIT